MAELNVDILILIFKKLTDDKNTLHSCLLVNREWCHLVVPILWKYHSWSEYRNGHKSEMLFKTIVNLLPSSSKQFLSENDITFPSLIPLKTPLFNYIKFCEFPDAEVIRTIILTMMYLYNNDERKLLEQELYKLFVSQCKGIEYFRWDMPQPLSLYPGASTCFSQLYSLYIDLDLLSSNALHEMAPICRDLYELSIGNYSQDLPGLISLIESQRNLNCIEFFYPVRKATCKELVKALASKSNTINELYLEARDTILPSLITPLSSLKAMTIHSTKKHKGIIEEIKEYLAIWEFPELQHLRIIDLSCFKEVATLIEKTKGNILQVSVHLTYKVTENTGMLIRAIANNCPKIKVFSTYLVPDEFILIKSLLISCRMLVEICLDSLNGSEFFLNNINENIGDELLDILIKFSPSSLVDITISGSWMYSNEALERFFESCRERTLEYFNMTCSGFRITEDHKEIVRKYVNEGVIKKTYGENWIFII